MVDTTDTYSTTVIIRSSAAELLSTFFEGNAGI